MEVLTENSRFDLTAEQLHARAADGWRATLAAYGIEHKVVGEQVAALTAQLRSLEQCTPATRHDETTVAIARVNIAERLAHGKARLINIADAIAAHRKAKP